MVFGLSGHRSGKMREEFANNKICYLSLAEALVVSPKTKGQNPPSLEPLFSNIAKNIGKTEIIHNIYIYYIYNHKTSL